MGASEPDNEIKKRFADLDIAASRFPSLALPPRALGQDVTPEWDQRQPVCGFRCAMAIWRAGRQPPREVPQASCQNALECLVGVPGTHLVEVLEPLVEVGVGGGCRLAGPCRTREVAQDLPGLAEESVSPPGGNRPVTICTRPPGGEVRER